MAWPRRSDSPAVAVPAVPVLQLGPRAAVEQLALLRERGLRIVAEKVETIEDFELCRDAGFEPPGELLRKPRIVRAHGVPGGGPDAPASLADIEATGGEFAALEEMIRRDVGLSSKLPRYTNSAFFGLPRELHSMQEALTVLGARTVARRPTARRSSGPIARPTPWPDARAAALASGEP